LTFLPLQTLIENLPGYKPQSLGFAEERKDSYPPDAKIDIRPSA
jgi:hypothetical protein